MGYTSPRLNRYAELGDEILTLAQLKGLSGLKASADTNKLVELTDGRKFYYHPTSALAADDIFVVAPADGAGRFLLAPGIQRVPLTVTAALANGAILATCPTGFRARVLRGDWGTPSASFTGGTSSSIGLSSSNATGHTTAGDFLGGGSGDVAASLTAGGFRPGTIGADIAAGAYLQGGNTIRYDEITSAFTAGSTVAGLELFVHANPGA